MNRIRRMLLGAVSTEPLLDVILAAGLTGTVNLSNVLT